MLKYKYGLKKMAVKSSKNTQADDQFHAAFRKWYESSGKKQVETAEFLGMTQGSFSNVLTRRRSLSLASMEEIASKIGMDLVSMLAEGRNIISDTIQPLPTLSTTPEPLTDEELHQQGFLKVPFSDHMKLAAGGGGTIPITDDAENSVVIVHGPSLGRHNAKNLQAFRVGGDSMEPLIAKGGIVMADTSPMHRDIMHIHEGDIYIICWDLEDGECAVKRLKWTEGGKGQWLSIESEEKFYRPVVKSVKDVVLIGRVIWSWREH